MRAAAREEVLAKGRAMLPALGAAQPLFAYAGLRPAGRGTNYVIGPPACPGLIDVAAIRSTGLSASLGIAGHVVSLIAEQGVALGPDRPLAPRGPVAWRIAGPPSTRWTAASSPPARCSSGCAASSSSRATPPTWARWPQASTTRPGRALAALAGLGAPWWRAESRAVLAGLHGGVTRAHVARAALAGIAWRVADVVEAVRETTRCAPTAGSRASRSCWRCRPTRSARPSRRSRPCAAPRRWPPSARPGRVTAGHRRAARRGQARRAPPRPLLARRRARALAGLRCRRCRACPLL